MPGTAGGVSKKRQEGKKDVNKCHRKLGYLCPSNFSRKQVKNWYYLLKLFLTSRFCSFNHVILPRLDLMGSGFNGYTRIVVRGPGGWRYLKLHH